MLETIHSEAIRLNAIISRFLDARQLESGERDLQKSGIDVEKLLTGCIAGVSPLAAAKQIQIRREVDEIPTILYADGTLLAQAVGNLLSNAIKYSPSETTVVVHVNTLASELCISVRDQGHGIPAAEIDNIFAKFYRLRRDASTTTAGTGLGLFFVKETAEKHGGYVTVESVENSGSSFVIHLPI